jgi:uncharacterized protein (TIGR00106 family)
VLILLNVLPLGKGESLSRHVAAALSVIEKSGLDYRLTAMGTIIEGDWDQVMRLVRRVRDAVRRRAGRVYLTLSIDDRKGQGRRLAAKVRSVETLLRKPRKR